jgi:hypothetical protein
MRHLAGPALALLLLCASGCGDDEPAVPPPPEPLRLPGLLTTPDGSAVDVSSDSMAVIFFWLPLSGYAPSEQDLAGIRDARRQGLGVFPVQFDPESRNTAQTQVNAMGLSLPVFLADSSLAAAIPCSILPVAVLFARGAEPQFETGEGCVSRLLDL